MFEHSGLRLEVTPAAMFSSFPQLFLQVVYIRVCVCARMHGWQSTKTHILLSKGGHFSGARAFCLLCLRLVSELEVCVICFPAFGLQTR